MGLNRMMMKNGVQQVNPTMTLTTARLGGHPALGFIILGGNPSPNYIFINGTKYTINTFATKYRTGSSPEPDDSVLSFGNNATPCSSIQFDIDGINATFTKQASNKTYVANDQIFTEEGRTYTIQVISYTL